MNFLNTVTSEMQAQAALKSIANAAAEKVWQEDFAKFCDKKKAFIADCVEAGLDIAYVEEALGYPDPMPARISIMTTVIAFGLSLQIDVAAGQLEQPSGPCGWIEYYAYAVSCYIDMPGSNNHAVIADPDAQSLYDALVKVSKAALDEVLQCRVIA
jgi:hypothetical protein